MSLYMAIGDSFICPDVKTFSKNNNFWIYLVLLKDWNNVMGDCVVQTVHILVHTLLSARTIGIIYARVTVRFGIQTFLPFVRCSGHRSIIRTFCKALATCPTV